MDLNRHEQKHEQHERADTQQRCFKSLHPETRDTDRIQNVPHLRFETSPSNDRLSGRRMIISWGSDIKSSNELNKWHEGAGVGQCYMSRLSVTHVTLPGPECDIEMAAAGC